MKPVRRLMIAVGAPLILLVGLGVTWGVRKGSGLVRQIEAWGQSFEHSSDPVELRVSGFPIISTMYVDGRKVGKLDRIVVLRNAPGEMDSLRIVAILDEEHLAHLAGCQIEVDPEAIQDGFPTEGWKQIMQCVSDTEGLAPFGSVVFEGTDRAAPLFVARHYLPCEDLVEVSAEGGGVAVSVSENVRAAVECARADRDRARAKVARLRDEIRRDVRKRVRSVRVKVP